MSEFEAFIEMAFTRLDTPALALARGKGPNSVETVPLFSVRLNAVTAMYTAYSLLAVLRSVPPERLAKFGITQDMFPDWPYPFKAQDK